MARHFQSLFKHLFWKFILSTFDGYHALKYADQPWICQGFFKKHYTVFRQLPQFLPLNGMNS